jgi:Trypsin-like peptidase domain/FHA domain
MLTVRHLNGALAGTETAVDAGKDRVVVGRQLDCDVQFPPEETAVARHHFALVRRPSGSWTVELFGEPFVAINGQPADNGEVVHDGAKFELGRIGGPSFTLGIKEDARTDNYLRTGAQEAAPSARAVAQRASSTARLARAIAAVAVVLAIGGGAYSAYQSVSARNEAARLDAAQKEFTGALAREANLRIGADTRAHLNRAVYLVLLQDTQRRLTPEGTAWVVGPNQLATNGHVAVARDALAPGEKMMVLAPGQNGKMYEVVSHKIHPGYLSFQAFLQSDVRALPQYRGRDESFDGNGYDVALLNVSEKLPEDARLELASADEIDAITPGSPLGTAGYPSERISGFWALTLGATPEQHVGVVTAITDMFHLPSDVAFRQLVHHDLPSTGGQSGSPIVGASGRVVALLNSGNAIPDGKGGRIPSAALVNYGQRVDLLKDLLDGTAEQKVADARKHWQEVLGYFMQGKDILPGRILAKARPDEGMKPRLVTEISRNLAAKAGRFEEGDNGGLYINYISAPQKLATGFDYLFMAITEDSNAGLLLQVDGSVVGNASGTNYPAIACRLLTTPQQNSGNPQKPRAACASGDERAAGMQVAAGKPGVRDVEVVVGNVKPASHLLASAELKYTLRVYQWVPDTAQGASAK